MKYDVTSKGSLFEQVKTFYPDTSASNVKKMIDSGRVYLNGVSTTDPRTETRPKDHIEVAPRSLRLPDGVKILYEDIDLMVVYKPEGLLSVTADKSPYHNLHSILKRYKPTRKITPLHRLDEGTSGILLFSFTDKAKDILKEDFERKRIDRRYCAIVEGVLEEKKGTWRNYLFETVTLTMKIGRFDGDGQIAITHYEVIAQNPRYAWIECKLETGRKNQIRVQAGHAGHPIVGDEKYGAYSDPLDRLCLHAYFLSFIHPINKKPMQFLVPPPARFYQLVKAPQKRYLLATQKDLWKPSDMPAKTPLAERSFQRADEPQRRSHQKDPRRPPEPKSPFRYSRKEALNRDVEPRSKYPTKDWSNDRNPRIAPSSTSSRSDRKEREDNPRRKVANRVDRKTSWTPKTKTNHKNYRTNK